MSGSVGKLNAGKEDWGKVGKEHIEGIMNDENGWFQNVVEKVSQEQVVEAMKEIKR